jgi:CHAD domain-containing protein
LNLQSIGSKKQQVGRQWKMEIKNIKMTQTEIENIIREIISGLERICGKVDGQFKKNDIHDLRVKIKKLRAFLRLLAMEITYPENLHLPRNLKEIYTVAGKVRELQLQLTRIKAEQIEKEKFTGYTSELKKQVKKRKEELNINLKQEHFQKMEVKILSSLPSNLDATTVEKFFHQKTKNIKLLLTASIIEDENLHSTRKNIKDLIYIHQILENSSLTNLTFLWNKDILEKIEELASEFGNFNDLCIALYLLRWDWLHELKPAEKKHLAALKVKWKLEKEENKKNLIAKAIEIITQHITEISAETDK